MDSTSISTFSLFSQTQLLNPKFNALRNSSLHRFTLKHTSISIQSSLKPSRIFADFSCSSHPRTPSSTSSTSSFPFLLPRILLKILSQNIAFLLIGSFVLIGFSHKRAALALPLEENASSAASLEENSDGASKEKVTEDEEMYEKILEKDPQNIEALKVILFKKIRMGKSKEAVKYVESLIDAEPGEVEWRLLLALCYETMGHWSKAKRLFKGILEERPLLIRALHGMAMVMHKNHEGPAVFEMLDKALELAYREKRVTEERNIKILIAQMHVAKGDLVEGLKRFQGLIDENPRDFRPYLCQGIIYSLLDKKEEAAQQFETYRSLVPEEFPQRGFLDDVVLTAKVASREQFQKEFQAQYKK